MTEMTEIDKELKRFEKCDVFTPEEIAKRMSRYLRPGGTLLDPSVGTGNLIRHLPDTYDRMDIYDIKSEYLDKCPNRVNQRKHCKDFIKDTTITEYDNIIMNPPYIKVQDLSVEYRAYIKQRWKRYSSGSFDIYILFLVKCLEQLKETGTMVAITPNAYLYNKTSREFREYTMKTNRYIKEIIDYKEEKVFPGTSVYTCITVFTKEAKENFLYNGERVDYDRIEGPDYNIFQAMTSKDDTEEVGGNGEQTGRQRQRQRQTRLSDICRIKNGLATLCNEVYIHGTKLYEEPCWRICKTSSEDKWIIYPYDETTGKVIEEEPFRRANPQTYEYLESRRAKLSGRDKGKKTYPAWYSYGRTQSIKPPTRGEVIYIPVFIDPVNIRYAMEGPVVYSGCLCIELTSDEYNNEEIIEAIKKNMEYIKSNSSKRGGGWINLSTKTLLNIPIE